MGTGPICGSKEYSLHVVELLLHTAAQIILTPPAPAMGARFYRPAGWLALLLLKAGDVETNPGPKHTRTQVWICDICHREINRKQTSLRCNHSEHWVHLRFAHIRVDQYTDTWICHLHRGSRLPHATHTSPHFPLASSKPLLHSPPTPPTPPHPEHQHTSNSPTSPTKMTNPRLPKPLIHSPPTPPTPPLPRHKRRTLAQLRTNKSPFLLSYLHKIDASTHPSPLCPLCRTHEHTTQHLFSCSQIHTTLSDLDLWRDPSGVAALLNDWREKLATNPHKATETDSSQ